MNLNEYSRFVAAVTSDESNNTDKMINRLVELQDAELLNPSLAITAAVGLSAEAGEFTEIVKKIVFQGKPCNDENVFHMKRELGDIMWYWVNACRALNLDPDDVIEENVRKLESRYPGGEFNTISSEHRKEGDI